MSAHWPYPMELLKSVFSGILPLFLVASFSTPVLAQKLSKLNVVHGAVSGDQLPAWVAKETGIFDKNGLDVQLIHVVGGSTTIMALLAHNAPIVQISGAAVVHSVLANSDAVMVAGGVTSLSYWLM